MHRDILKALIEGAQSIETAKIKLEDLQKVGRERLEDGFCKDLIAEIDRAELDLGRAWRIVKDFERIASKKNQTQ